jgi:glycosyltransferase involved in cell wall biosynthesis
MKIQFLITEYLPDVFGGAEVYTLNLTQGLKAAGHDVMVVSTGIVRKNNEPQDEDYQGIPVHRFGFDFPHRPPQFFALQAYKGLYEEAHAWFTETRPDAVHVTSAWFMPSILLAAMELDIPVVGTHVDFVWSCRESHLLKKDFSSCANTTLAGCRDCYTDLSDSQWPLVRNLKEDLLRTLAAGYSFHHCPCGLLGDQILALGAEPDTVEVWPYGIPDQLPEKRRGKNSSSKLRLGFIGRWNRIKGIDILLDAMDQLKDRTDIELHLYGEQEVWNSDAYGAEMADRAKGLEQVFMQGRFDPKDVGIIHQDIDCIVTSSIWPENSPVSMLEALALGTPVICADGAGMTNLIEHGQNGLVFKSRDAADLAKQILALADDREMLLRMQRDVRCLRTISDDVAKFEQVYAEAQPVSDPVLRERIKMMRNALFFAEGMLFRGERESAKMRGLSQAGHQKIALFGAGRNLVPVLRETELGDVEIIAIFDDNEAVCGRRVYGFDVHHSDRMDEFDFSAIVAVSEVYGNQMAERLAPLADKGIAVEKLYG